MENHGFEYMADMPTPNGIRFSAVCSCGWDSDWCHSRGVAYQALDFHREEEASKMLHPSYTPQTVPVWGLNIPEAQIMEGRVNAQWN